MPTASNSLDCRRECNAARPTVPCKVRQIRQGVATLQVCSSSQSRSPGGSSWPEIPRRARIQGAATAAGSEPISTHRTSAATTRRHGDLSHHKPGSMHHHCSAALSLVGAESDQAAERLGGGTAQLGGEHQLIRGWPPAEATQATSLPKQTINAAQLLIPTPIHDGHRLCGSILQGQHQLLRYPCRPQTITALA